MLGDGHRRHLQLRRAVEQLADAAGAVEQRELGVQMQVDELVHPYSHSIVAGGFELMSYTTRLMPRTSLTMRDEIGAEQVVRQPRPVGRHAVAALDRADRDRVLVGALVAHHADALHRQQHRERLPEPPVPAGLPDLVDDDGVGAPQQIEPLARDRAEQPDRQARARKRLAPDELVVEPERRADGADLVLEQLRAAARPA